MSSAGEQSELIPVRLPHPERFEGQLKVVNWLVEPGEDVLLEIDSWKYSPRESCILLTLPPPVSCIQLKSPSMVPSLLNQR
ncbi:MAG: hypothetical protein R3C11_26065 [Planctomycetaceae bacterium]